MKQLAGLENQLVIYNTCKRKEEKDQSKSIDKVELRHAIDNNKKKEKIWKWK